MANTKEYTIKINGLQESVNAVESLNKQLNTLEQKMKTLSSSKVSTGGGNSTKANAALSEEERVQKEINKLKQQGAQLDAKIVAAQDEIYKRVDATKQLYKETIADQKALAAAERLQADAYSNTMQGMKSKLADLKAVINTTDLGDAEQIKKLTEEANKLTQTLKGMEEAYGQFGRNVGNYKDSLNGITVVIGGMERQFGSAREAARTLKNELTSLTAAGKGNTEQAKELRREYNKLKSAMDDATKSSKFMDEAMDAMESFTAIQQVTRGFSTFFGFDNAEMEKQIARLIALQNVLQGIEKLNKQIDAQEGIGKWFAKGSDSIDKFVMGLTGAQKRMGMLVMETRTASIAVQGLSKALKLLGGATVIGGIMLLTSLIGETIDSFNKWINGGIEVGDAAEMLSGEFNTMAKTLERLKNENASAWFNNMSTDAAYLKNNVYKVNEELLKLLTNLEDIQKLGEVKTSFGLTGNIKKTLATNVADAKDEYKKQLKIVSEYENKIENSLNPIAKTFNKIFGGANQNKRNVKELGEAILNDFLYRVQEASARAQSEILKTGKVSKQTARDIEELNKEANEDFATNSVLNNIAKFSDKGAYYENQINGVKTALQSLYETVSDTSLDPDKLMQLSIDAMKDGLAKQKAQAELDRKREIDNVKGNLEAIAYINAKYDRQILEAEKNFAKEYRASLNDLYRLRIELMRDGLAKQLALLNQEKREKIQAIQDDEKLVGERTKAVQELYQKKILDAKRDWAYEMVQVYNQMYEEIDKTNRDAMQREAQNALQNIENDTNIVKGDLWRGIISTNQPNNIQDRVRYYDELLKVEKDYADKEADIKDELLEKDLDYTKKEEQLRHERMADAKTVALVMGEISKVPEGTEANYAEMEQKLRDQLSQMRGTLVDAYNEGKLEFKDFVKAVEDEQDAHNAKINSLEKEFNAQSEKNYQDWVSNNKRIVNNYYQNILSTIRTRMDDISRVMSQQPILDKSGWGIINIGETRKNYEMSVDVYKNAAMDIEKTKQQLKADLNANKITAEDFFMRNAELDAMKKSIDDSLKDISQKNANLLSDFQQSINRYIQAIGSAIQDVMGSIADYQDYMFDKEQDELDKANDELDKKLDEQQDIVQKHKDAIESIEDELATARGDRRQHLIDQLNAQIAAQRAAAAEEKKLQKQKEANEKKQEALDKKRREAEYKRNLMSIIVSTAMATANGLATQPFIPVGIAMGALATTLGMVQYALAAQQKPYANGGQLDGGVAQGKRHSEGGIPVLGGRASIEGGEFITNRQTTAKNVDLLEYINSKKKKVDLDDLIDFYNSGKTRKNIQSVRRMFADGGTLPTMPSQLDIQDQLQNIVVNQDNRPIYVSVVDINNKQDDVRRVQTLAGL